jgi:hydrogenase maturation protein HypF
MFPVQGDDEMDAVRHYVTLTPMEEQLISSTARPIVLVKKNHGCTLPDSIAPGLDELGCCLPYSPLHYLLANSFNAPLIATSANISGEPVLTDEHEITQRLAHVTATCLHHDRPIARPADDSVVRVIAGRPRTLRVGRGYAPVEMSLPIAITKPTLAVGAHMKNSIALAWDNRLVLSPHISDLGTVRSLSIFEQVIDDFQTLYDVEVEQITCDAHPGYSSSRWAHQQNLPVLPVLHHHAHASALALEFPQHKPWLVFTWDGTGYGEADQLWGGEAFYGTPGNWRRVASFKPFRLMGGDLASRQAWRSAAALCWQSGEHYEVPQNQSLVKQAWEQQINCMNSSSVGRLFDAASALTGLATEYSFEGQGPMLLEAQCDHSHPASPLLVTYENQIYSADWQPLLTTLTDDQLTIAERGIYFHETLAATLVEQAKLIRQEYGELVIGLAGGVFQNKFLTERAIHYLNHSRFDCYVNEVIPLNDGGISAGQIMETLAGQNKRT